MNDNEKVISELKSASEWFTEHGRNTNTAIIGICERAIDLINRLQADIEKLKAETTIKAVGGIADLIKQQQAEIERLQKENEYILMQHAFQRRPDGSCWNDVIEKAKSETRKEFAERALEERNNAD